MAFTPQERADLTTRAAEIIARYPKPRSALLPLLHLVQAREGFVSTDGIAFAQGNPGWSEADVTAVVSFYTMCQAPSGRRVPRRGSVTNTLCAIMGGDMIHDEPAAILGSRATSRHPTASGQHGANRGNAGWRLRARRWSTGVLRQPDSRVCQGAR
jgi:NADH:ubiquinone oxidoreductase subunit E